MEKKKRRLIWSLKNELLEKSREAALCAVQTYNNPNITFKSESFVVLMIIAWTYLLHAYYREKVIEYRYFKLKENGKRRIFNRTKSGSFKYWELEQCLNHDKCPLDNDIKNNLKFLIGLRHEIEHQMTQNIDEFLSAKLQACCLNYNESIKRIFNRDLASYQPISLQFFAFTEEQVDTLKDALNVPKNVIGFVKSFESELDANARNSPKYSYRVIYIRENVNHEGQADRAYRFINEGSEEGKEIHNILIKSKKRPSLTFEDLTKELKLNRAEVSNLLQHLNAKNNNAYCEKTIIGKKTPTWKYSDECLQAMKKWLKDNDKSDLKNKKKAA